ncbi:uncharacterized protein LOC144752404 [Lissotriton helveticus]
MNRGTSAIRKLNTFPKSKHFIEGTSTKQGTRKLRKTPLKTGTQTPEESKEKQKKHKVTSQASLTPTQKRPDENNESGSEPISTTNHKNLALKESAITINHDGKNKTKNGNLSTNKIYDIFKSSAEKEKDKEKNKAVVIIDTMQPSKNQITKEKEAKAQDIVTSGKGETRTLNHNNEIQNIPKLQNTIEHIEKIQQDQVKPVQLGNIHHQDLTEPLSGVPMYNNKKQSFTAQTMDNLDCSEDEEVIGGSPVREVPLRSTVRGRSLERGQMLSVDSAWRGTEPGLNVVCRNTSTPVQTFSFQDRDRCGGPDLAGRGPVPSRQGEVRRVPSAALSVPPRDPAAASTRGSGVTPLAPTSSRYRWQALPAAKELQSQRTGRYRRVQSAPPPGVSKSFKCTVVDTGLGKTRGDLLHTSVDSVVLDYDEESPEEGEVRDPERGVPSHVSSSVLQAPVVQSQVQGRREHGPSSRAPRRPDALTSETRAEPSRVVSLLPGSVAGPRSSVVTVWIVGHSFVKWARVQAARSYFGDLLGFNDRMFNVLWKGKGGMLWRELIPCLNNNMVGGVCPDILVIHLGENDLCATKGVVLLRAMKRDLGLIKERWAGCHVFWTELIPRRIWRGAVNPRAVDRARKKVNSEVSRCCRSLGFSRISHRDIKFESVEFFRDDGVHLSRVGMALYLLEIREVLARALAMQR